MVDHTQTSWQRVCADFRQTLHTARFWVAEVSVVGICGVGSALLGWPPALTLVTPAALASMVFIALWITAPVRQRDELRADYAALTIRRASAVERKRILDELGQLLMDGEHLLIHQDWHDLDERMAIEATCESAGTWIVKSYRYLEENVGHDSAALFHSNYGVNVGSDARRRAEDIKTWDEVEKMIAPRCAQLVQIIQRLQSIDHEWRSKSELA